MDGFAGKRPRACGPIQNIAEVFEDPQVLAREMKLELEHPVVGKVPGIANPIKFSKTPPQNYRKAPPLLGEDTDAVLARVLGKKTPKIFRNSDPAAFFDASGPVFSRAGTCTLIRVPAPFPRRHNFMLVNYERIDELGVITISNPPRLMHCPRCAQRYSRGGQSGSGR